MSEPRGRMNRWALSLSGGMLLVSGALALAGQIDLAAAGFLLVFVLLLIGMWRHRILHGFMFTVWVLTAVVVALLYPESLTQMGGFNTEVLIVPLIQIIMFGMGTAMSLGDFAGVLRMPKGVFVGLGCQFTIMPVLAVTLVWLAGFPPEVGAGILLIGCSPSGVSSNVMAFISKGNLALSVTLTACATLLAPLVTPFLMVLLADRLVPIEFLSMMVSILKMIILPVVLGLVFHHLFKGKMRWLHEAMPLVAMAANVLIIGIIVAAGRDHLLSIGLLLLVVAILHNAAGYVLGYWGCRWSGMDKRDSRTIAFEVGMQNGGMAAGIASEMGRAATMGLFPAVFGTWMDVSGSMLANWWRERSPDDSTKDAVSEK